MEKLHRTETECPGCIYESECEIRIPVRYCMGRKGKKMLIKNDKVEQYTKPCLEKFKQVQDKPDFTLVPNQIEYQIEAVRQYGNRKYPEGGPDNWK